MKELLKLEDIIDVEAFQGFQDDISKATDMALLTVDYKGVPITQHSLCKSYCKLMRRNPQHKALCQKCDSRGGLEAARMHQPYIYVCHRGLVDLAVPIVANGQYLGAMMAGQVRLSNPHDTEKLERICEGKDTKDEQDMLDLYWKELPQMGYEKIEAIGNMLFHISQSIVEKSMLRLLHGSSKAPETIKPITPISDITYTELEKPLDPRKPLP